MDFLPGDPWDDRRSETTYDKIYAIVDELPPTFFIGDAVVNRRTLYGRRIKLAPLGMYDTEDSRNVGVYIGNNKEFYRYVPNTKSWRRFRKIRLLFCSEEEKSSILQLLKEVIS